MDIVVSNDVRTQQYLDPTWFRVIHTYRKDGLSGNTSQGLTMYTQCEFGFGSC